MKLAIETIDVSIQELEVLVDRTRQELLDEEGYRKLKGAIETLGQMARMLADQKTTLRQLRDLLLKPPATEKTRAVLERAGIATRQNQPNGGDQKPDATGPAQADQKKKGHAERTQAWAQPGAGFSGSAEGARPASHPEAGRTVVRNARKGKCTRCKSRPSACGSWVKRPCRQPSTIWRGCAATCARRYSRRRRRKGWGRKSTMSRRRAWWHC